MAKKQAMNQANCDPYSLLNDDFDEILGFLDKKNDESDLNHINENVRKLFFFSSRNKKKVFLIVNSYK